MFDRSPVNLCFSAPRHAVQQKSREKTLVKLRLDSIEGPLLLLVKGLKVKNYLAILQIKKLKNKLKPQLLI
jgi:hypothetical protein